MRILTPTIIDTIRADAKLLGEFAAHIGLKAGTAELYLRVGQTKPTKLRKLSTPAAEAFLRRKLKLAKEAEVITETDGN